MLIDDGTIPDSNWLYNNHRASVLCRKAENQECVTYTFWDNGLGSFIIEYITKKCKVENTFSSQSNSYVR